MTVLFGIAGDVGSFSEEAAFLYAQQKKIDPIFAYLLDMEGVLNAIEDGVIELGIIPVVNFLGGLVKPAFLAMGKHLFTPVDDFWHEINQCLLTRSNTDLSQIKHIVSHPQGLAQCQQFLQREFKNTGQIEWIDTAKAAKDLAKGVLPSSSAVIAPERCAELYGLEIKAKNIQDSSPNRTAFILVKKRSDTTTAQP